MEKVIEELKKEGFIVRKYPRRKVYSVEDKINHFDYCHLYNLEQLEQLLKEHKKMKEVYTH